MTRRPLVRTSAMTAALLALYCASMMPVAAGRIAMAQMAQKDPQPLADNPNHYVTPPLPMNPSPLAWSLAELVAVGWRVVGVTLSGRTLHYHLANGGALAVCAVDTMPDSPASRCVRLDPAPR